MSLHITSGTLKGRGIIVARDADFRPTTGYGRQMIFNILGADFGGYFLDLFAGSGAVGLEAVSRGAEQVVFVENDPRQVDNIEATIEKLGLDEVCTVICADASKPDYLDLKRRVFDVVFLDPPYDSLPMSNLDGMSRFVKPGGLLIYEHSSRMSVETAKGFCLRETRKAGDSAFSFFSRD